MGDHVMWLDDVELAAIYDVLKAYVAAFASQVGGQVVALDSQRSADMAARLSRRVQRHSAGLCDCPRSPSLGGTH